MKLAKYTVENQLTLRRYYVDHFFARHVPSLPPGALVLDLGGHKIRKRGFFDIGGFELRVVYANLARDRLPDVQANAERLPICGNQFDAIICSELLEHVMDPHAELAEGFRVLKPGGRLLLTAPFLYPIHADPWDYNRHTDQYWLTVMDSVGFRVTRIEKQGLFFSVATDFLRLYFAEVAFLGRGTSLARRLLKRPLALLAQWAVNQDAKHAGPGNEFISSFATGFGIVALKP